MNHNISDSYRRFAKFYDALVLRRGHFEKQAATVRRLIGVERKATIRVLDAACGTGKVLSLLAQDSRIRPSGADGSAEMLGTALGDKNNEGIPFTCCRWENLPLVFRTQGTFDCIFFLGNAIAHCETKDQIAEIIDFAFGGLNPGGIVLFDFRTWIPAETGGQLVAAGRPDGHERDWGEFHIDNEVFHFSDVCSYGNGLQRTTFIAKGASESTEQFVFSYLPFVEEDALSWLRNAGFRDCKIMDLTPDYPYLIAYGIKKP